MKRLLLFDIDLTMIKTGGAGLLAMGQAFRKFTGHTEDIIPIRFDGKTDPTIIPSLFETNGYTLKDEEYEPFMQTYLEILESETLNPEGWELMPGVVELLEILQKSDEFYLAIVTGNDERGARLKLKPFDLNRFFPVGGFASDSAIRHELVPIAIKRAEKHFNQKFDLDEVIIIGDSVGDVTCANTENVKCLAVLTGHTSALELTKAGECTIFNDLSDTDKVLEFFRK